MVRLQLLCTPKCPLQCSQGSSQPSCSFTSLGRGALPWHTALASVHVCFVEGWLCLCSLLSACNSCPFPTAQALGSAGALGFRAQGCSEANTYKL